MKEPEVMQSETGGNGSGTFRTSQEGRASKHQQGNIQDVVLRRSSITAPHPPNISAEFRQRRNQTVALSGVNLKRGNKNKEGKHLFCEA